MPQCDSSETYTRAVWLLPSPADLLPDWAAGVSEVSRFSCMKFLGVSGVFDYAGLNQRLAISPLFMLPSAHYNCVGVLIASFRSSIARPTYTPVYASLRTSRCVNAKLGAEWFASPFS